MGKKPTKKQIVMAMRGDLAILLHAGMCRAMVGVKALSKVSGVPAAKIARILACEDDTDVASIARLLVPLGMRPAFEVREPEPSQRDAKKRGSRK